MIRITSGPLAVSRATRNSVEKSQRGAVTGFSATVAKVRRRWSICHVANELATRQTECLPHSSRLQAFRLTAQALAYSSLAPASRDRASVGAQRGSWDFTGTPLRPTFWEQHDLWSRPRAAAPCRRDACTTRQARRPLGNGGEDGGLVVPTTLRTHRRRYRQPIRQAVAVGCRPDPRMRRRALGPAGGTGRQSASPGRAPGGSHPPCPRGPRLPRPRRRALPGRRQSVRAEHAGGPSLGRRVDEDRSLRGGGPTPVRQRRGRDPLS